MCIAFLLPHLGTLLYDLGPCCVLANPDQFVTNAYFLLFQLNYSDQSQQVTCSLNDIQHRFYFYARIEGRVRLFVCLLVV